MKIKLVQKVLQNQSWHTATGDTELTFRPERKSLAGLGENEGMRRLKQEPMCISREELSHAMTEQLLYQK